ncbi:Methyl-accepting chemotaxis protein 4 [Tepidimonas alkaliphilus]|uniref:Methyl-accepting chemotaxis protein 4 n=1 Tax=Tepidimonas alkaliphilus TaxID=2588942 RepID=A0A554WBS3_9BURK|nr:methyl-accepting chemotaxis protein [Tepidimonas alkaliphilus]TSE21032.1 Methyl-accepting chemotaxis protein 4 [Tepidimonas alkaliphilus]
MSTPSLGQSLGLAGVVQSPAWAPSGAFRVIVAPGVRCFQRLRFAGKALVISLSFMLPMIALILGLLVTQARDARQARMDATRQHVEVAHGVLVWAHGLEQSGQLSRAEAQDLAKRAVAALRYDRVEYFWINDMEPRVVMHPVNPKLDGQPAGDIRDPNGFALFRGFVDKVRSEGEGFVAYQWPRPGSDEPVDKLSYVKGFAPWGWVIGSGIYVDDLRASEWRRWKWVGGVSLLALLVSGYLFFSFYCVMSSGLRETREHLQAIARGDLTRTPQPHGSDETAQLLFDLRAMQDALRHMVEQVRASSDRIVQASAEIAAGAHDLSARTEATASNLEESAASMEQIVAAVQSGSSLLDEAARTARDSARGAIAGGRVMQDVERTMADIRQSSQRIGEIIGTIDGIAFQTNILALNAAVEAARAGEHGRGFAVVAGEVRSLAQRSAAAAREIKALIDASVAQVGAGAQVVVQAGQAMRDIVTSAERVDRLLEQVANGAQEQHAGIAQVGQALQELDRMTQQNAALVEQTAAATASLRQLAQSLAQEVDRFVLPQRA